jgi:hypothetical protein
VLKVFYLRSNGTRIMNKTCAVRYEFERDGDSGGAKAFEIGNFYEVSNLSGTLNLNDS